MNCDETLDIFAAAETVFELFAVETLFVLFDIGGEVSTILLHKVILSKV